MATPALNSFAQSHGAFADQAVAGFACKLPQMLLTGAES